MSGSSFNYLYRERPEPPAELVAMVEEAETLGFERGAAALRRLLEGYERLAEQWDGLEDFMHAFEWMVSADYTRDQAREAEAKLPPQIKVVATAEDLAVAT